MFFSRSSNRAIQSSAIHRSRTGLMRLAVLLWLAGLLAGSHRAIAQDQALSVPPPAQPQVAGQSDEAIQAIPGIQVPDAWRVEVYAAEPDVANGVALFVDVDQSVWVCESFRQENGIEDNRNHSEWLIDDLAAESVEDRLAYIKKHLGSDANSYTEQDDRIKVLRDTDGDGKADAAEVFASGFNSILAGTGAGVLRYRGDVFYTCIPDLWLLRDQDGDGQAEFRKSLHTGFGVRFAFRGHDMHGLILGPDGRLYFSIGDRGYNVQSETGHWVNPASGAVFRCELDGSDFQVIATGLRNPQELAFDEFGNLFTGDNNSDSGDQARWVYVASGGDSGWRMFYQYLPDRGPFNRERIWNPYDATQTPAYIVPPIANFSDGPSGLAYYPGTGLGPAYDGRFFLCDFRGQSSNSGVRSFRNQSQGAFFELVDAEQSIWQVLATDLHFGPDGQIYLLDWVHGWVGEGKGRVYRVFDPQQQQTPIVAQVKSLLAGGIAQAESSQLLELLAHRDMRVRQEAQFELVRRGELGRLLQATRGEGFEGVEFTAERVLLARLHGIWGSMQLYRQHHKRGPAAKISDENADAIVQNINHLLKDPAAKVRALAAEQSCEILSKVSIGDRWDVSLPPGSTHAGDAGKHTSGADVDADALTQLISDPDARVAYFAALAIGKHRIKPAAAAVIERLNANADRDPVLRHGCIMALVGMDDPDVWEMASQHSSPAVRLATVVAMRRLGMPQIEAFLSDGQALVVIEAARAIHDLPIVDALPALANLLPRSGADDALVRRSLNANFRLGGMQQARRIAEFAASGSSSTDRRIDALEMLATWDAPGELDKVTNQYRPLDDRDNLIAIDALKECLPRLLASEETINSKTIEVAAALGIQQVAPILRQVIADKQRNGSQRASALVSLFRLEGDSIEPLVRQAADDSAAQVRASAVVLLTQIDPELAGTLLEKTIRQGEVVERQAALQAIAELREDAGKAALSLASEMFVNDKWPAECQLDLIAALQQRQFTDLLSKVNQHREVGDGDAVAARYAELLYGGNSENGRKVFYEKTEVSCVRCHMIGKVGGAVGPQLSDIASKKDRAYLLESIIEPNRQIADGFQTELVLDFDGVTHSGIVKQDTDEFLELMNADGALIRIEQANIEARKRGLSSMPADIKDKLTPSEIRDLIEFLASLKDPAAAQNK